MEVQVGQVTHYFTHLEVAVVELGGEVRLGDALLFLGYTTDFRQVVCSMEVDHRKIQTALPGTSVAIKVNEPVRVNDRVFKIVEGAENPENPVLWMEMYQAFAAIYPTYQGVLSSFQHQQGVSEAMIGLLLAALTLEPGTISSEKLRVRGPYTSASEWMARLHAAKEKKWMLEPEPGEFRLSPKGSSAVRKMVRDSRKAMQKADPLPSDEGRRLAQYLSRLVQACLFTAPPPDTWSIRLSFQLMPDEAPPMPYIEQALSCIQAYRDDAHLAAWQPSGLSAPALEALTLIWRGQATSLDELYNRLAQRGFALHDYQAALNELRERGYLEGPDEDFRLTETGDTFRAEVEAQTERFFFAPFDCLSTDEKMELACLLSTLRSGLEKRKAK